MIPAGMVPNAKPRVSAAPIKPSCQFVACSESPKTVIRILLMPMVLPETMESPTNLMRKPRKACAFYGVTALARATFFAMAARRLLGTVCRDVFLSLRTSMNASSRVLSCP